MRLLPDEIPIFVMGRSRRRLRPDAGRRPGGRTRKRTWFRQVFEKSKVCAEQIRQRRSYAMKRLIALWAACLLLVPSLLLAAEKAPVQPKLDTFSKKLSYAMGTGVGKYFRKLGKDIDFDTLLAGIHDAYSGNKLAMSDEEITTVQRQFGARMQAKEAAQMKDLAAKNLAAGTKFLNENKKKTGVIVTKSGLQYQFLKKGDGPIPKASDKVKVDYVGTFINGKEFDSSIKRGKPVVFGVDQVIPGWSEALQLMPVGSKVRLVIPPSLAYGAKGVMPRIEPNSVLVFEVTLHSIEK